MAILTEATGILMATPIKRIAAVKVILIATMFIAILENIRKQATKWNSKTT